MSEVSSLVPAAPDMKQRIARQFSRAAERYDKAAKVQERIATVGINKLPESLGKVVDIGCGTGRVTGLLQARAKQAIGIDLAEGMARLGASVNGNIPFMVGDAEALPLASSSVDQVFSSMALQWCEQPDRVMSEAARVLRSGGTGVLLIMTEGSMHELHASWQTLDKAPHVNRFNSQRCWHDASTRAGLKTHSSVKTFVTWHPHVRGALASIKDIGANVVTTQRGSSKPILRADLQRLNGHYRAQFGTEEGLPLSYQVTLLEIAKP